MKVDVVEYEMPRIERHGLRHFLQSPVGCRYLTTIESIQWILRLKSIKDFY